MPLKLELGISLEHVWIRHLPKGDFAVASFDPVNNL
jgi:hypothetical protein